METILEKQEVEEPLILPYTVIVDTREGHPFNFQGFRGDARQNRRPLVVPLISKALKSGDYSLEGFEDQIAIERKSLQDAYGTFCDGRDRFERELARLNELRYAAVVIEAAWPSILQPQTWTKFSFKSFFRSVIAWQIRYPRVHWWPCHTRNFAERVTLRLLERFWLDEQAKRLAEEGSGKQEGSGDA